VEHGEQAAVGSEDGAQAEFRLAIADPALPRLILHSATTCHEMPQLRKKPRMLAERRAEGDVRAESLRASRVESVAVVQVAVRPADSRVNQGDCRCYRPFPTAWLRSLPSRTCPSRARTFRRSRQPA